MDSQSSSTQATSQQDNRNVLGQGANLAQSGSSITQVDGRQLTEIDNSVSTTLDATVANNAINTTADASVRNLNAALSFGRAAMDNVNQGENRVLDAVTQSNDMVKNAYADAKGRGALTDKILIGAIAMAGIVAFTAIKGKA